MLIFSDTWPFACLPSNLWGIVMSQCVFFSLRLLLSILLGIAVAAWKFIFYFPCKALRTSHLGIPLVLWNMSVLCVFLSILSISPVQFFGVFFSPLSYVYFFGYFVAAFAFMLPSRGVKVPVISLTFLKRSLVLPRLLYDLHCIASNT